ncbi:type II toxin-antitoxin system RelE/ParE family toxin [bacterium]|nr:type II toxin-antitoxin system RelE/ParE family toxin [bacterium]
METQERSVVLSPVAEKDIQDIYVYGYETFGKTAAESFKAELLFLIRTLKNLYEMYPECRYLRTKSQIYRNIILGSYLVIFRITSERIEVLKVVSSRISVSKIKKQEE